jgi:hypothetical protein
MRNLVVEPWDLTGQLLNLSQEVLTLMGAS